MLAALREGQGLMSGTRIAALSHLHRGSNAFALAPQAHDTNSSQFQAEHSYP